MAKQKFEKLLNKKMTRSEFMKYAGASVLAIVGVTGAMKNLGLSDKPSKGADTYGNSTYGSKKEG